MYCLLMVALIWAASSGWGAVPSFLTNQDRETVWSFPADEARLESFRTRGDMVAQRRHMWHLFAAAVRSTDQEVPVFLSWFGAGEVFPDPARRSSPQASPRELRSAFSSPKSQFTAAQRGAPPLIIRAHYNRAATEHIYRNKLDLAATLSALADVPAAANSMVRAIPEFPRDSMVLKTAWWPVPEEGVVPLPIWDPERNPISAHGNDYPTWSRLVGVSQSKDDSPEQPPIDLEFMGKPFHQVRRIAVDEFINLTLDTAVADELMKDPISQSASYMLLGRELRAGDRLILVAMHVATRETKDWIWGTLWWHDSPNSGSFATLRTADVTGAASHYLMNVAFDSTLPLQPDGSAHIAFNPWLEARFPDTGDGAGAVSNCMSCHARAATDLITPFNVTRGDTAQVAPPSGKALRTSSLWSIPMQAR